MNRNLPVVRTGANESWLSLIWLKRVLPLIVIAALAGGYFLWDDWSTARRLADEDQVALVTAQVWIATAKYRNDPERYIEYRDSLLEANDVPRDRVYALLGRQEDQPEELLPFARKVQRLVDSIYRIEDSVARETEKRIRDSIAATSPEPEKR